MKTDHYILNPVTKCAEPIEVWVNGEIDTQRMLEWARNFENKKLRRVAATNLWSGRVFISTVFLGLDHGWGLGRPLLFETMVFGGGSAVDGEQWRCSTWEEAEAQHRDAIVFVRKAIKRPDKLPLPTRRRRIRKRRLARKQMRDSVKQLREEKNDHE